MAHERVRVPHVEAEPQTRIVHLPRDLRQQRRLRLHHIFERDGHPVRQLPQELPPELHRLLDVPLGKIHLRHEPAVDDEPVHTQFARQTDGLAVAPARDLPHERVDGTGRQLRKRRMQPEAADARHLRAHLRPPRRILQHRRIAEVRDLIAQPIFARKLRGAAVDPGEI